MPFAAVLLMLLPPEVTTAAEQALLPLGMTPSTMNFERHWSTTVAMPDSLVLSVLADVWLLPVVAFDRMDECRAYTQPSGPGGGFDELLEFLRAENRRFETVAEGLGAELADSLSLVLGSLWAETDTVLPDMEWGAVFSCRGRAVPWEYSEMHPESLSALLQKWPGTPAPPVSDIIALAVSAPDRWLDTPRITADLPGMEGDVVAWSLEGPVTWVVGGTGPNRYLSDCPFALIVDLGGDDFYGPGVGGVVGTAGRGFVTMVVDRAGNDTWESGDCPVAQGGAVLGFACVVDMEGDDTYRASGMSQGSGMLGHGILADLAGDDIYQATIHAQGAGTLGSGLLIDVYGDDMRRVASYGQGFGGPQGQGELVDGGGHDVYMAGFSFPHEPLLPRDNRAMSQGFGMGLRPFIAGGIGALLDCGEGNDTYRAEVFGQGCSYWYALGILVDEGGQDVYSAAQYSQGTGIHLSAGVLLDLSGDDQFVSRNGPAQGSAHDLSTGFLFDGEGSDIFVTDGGQGLALTNSAAVFADMGGNDLFAVRNLGQGQATWARGSSGSGLFLSMADADRYLGAGRDSTAWGEEYSAGVDLLSVSQVDPEFIEPVGEPASLDLDSLFSVASEWGVGGNAERVTAHLDEMVARGDEAVAYVLTEHLDSWDGLEHRAITAVLKGNKDTSLASLLALLEGGELSGRRFSNTVSWLGEVGIDEARPAIEGLLSDTLPTGRTVTVIRALGNIGSEASVPVLLPFAGRDNSLVRRETAVSLGLIGSQSAQSVLETLSEDPELDVLSAARRALELLGEKGDD
ncbi:MAG: HEAT repeat domain-containing protein [Candidatus Fermentibacteraceae bacterium]